MTVARQTQKWLGSGSAAQSQQRAFPLGRCSENLHVGDTTFCVEVQHPLGRSRARSLEAIGHLRASLGHSPQGVGIVLRVQVLQLQGC